MTLSMIARLTMSGRNSEIARRSEDPLPLGRGSEGGAGAWTVIQRPPADARLRARLSWSTLTLGSPTKPRPRPPVYVSIRRLTVLSPRRRDGAAPEAWNG